MIKAYGRIEWVFLREMMDKMGFSQVWITMIMRCVQSVRFSIKLMGALLSILFLREVYGREIPNLFLFCVEGFSTLLKQAQVDKQISGVKFRSNGPTVTPCSLSMTAWAF
jgi:hypothetical protein